MFVVVAFLALFGLGFLPLLGGAGYEAALLSGLIAPSLAALDVRRRIERKLRLERSLGGGELARIALAGGGAHVATLLGAAGIHTLRIGPCEPAAGFVELLLGPAAGVLLATTLAAVVSVVVLCWFGAARLGAVSVLVVGPFGSALLSALLFYCTPAVYAFDPFVGHFRGPLYDVVEFEPERLLLYRVGTLASVGALLAALSGVSLTRAPARPPRVRLLWGARWLAAGLLALLSVGHSLSASELGFVTTEARLERELPGRVTWGSCTVRYGLDVARTAAERTARECSGHLLDLRGRLGLHERWPVRVLLFSGPSEKAAFMGAGTTYIAKPWRREVYVQVGDYPHAVLGHELAHVVLGELGSGPFRIAGHLGGYLPDPGRIEGFAVYAAPREGAEATTRQWAAALARVAEMPPIEQVFGVEFLGASAARSYTVAGAFVEYVVERHGAIVARRWYAGEELSPLTGESWPNLDGGFRAWLRETDVPDGVLSLAQLRFAAPGLFGRRCPHAADRALGLALLACGTEPERVTEFVERAIALDSSKTESRCLVPACLAPAGKLDEATRRARALLARPGTIGDPSARDLLELLGDVAWARGDARGALGEYERAARIEVGAAQERALALKVWALSAGEPARDAVYRLLARVPLPSELGDPNLVTVAGFGRARGTLERWRHEPTADGTPSYLLALGTLESDSEEGLRLLDDALARGLLSPEFELEARARSVLVSTAMGRLDEADARLGRLRPLLDQLPAGRVRADQLARLIERERLALTERPHPAKRPRRSRARWSERRSRRAR